ncbi:hypothetical protein [Paenibacillus qinlingensis]|nr:hypothetical protein [Paenibacillus qinlingensis]NQX63146.1 hypothetical protein [Paenibacillus qinlingensis]
MVGGGLADAGAWWKTDGFRGQLSLVKDECVGQYGGVSEGLMGFAGS